jgi:hypothetical protein
LRLSWKIFLRAMSLKRISLRWEQSGLIEFAHLAEE